jgi:transcriptional regulator GlxA family with amidase domain
MRKPKNISILALPNVQLLDVAGPLDVFAEANKQARANIYELRVIGCFPGPIRSSSGTRIVPDEVIGQGIGDKIDTLLIAGAPNAPEMAPDTKLIQWLNRVMPATRRYGSVCSGAFILAKAGLLNGRRVTTHWAVAEHLAKAFPAIRVEADAIHVRDGRLRTAAGVTAGLDLALALVEEDLGREVALKVSAQLVMFFKRPGGQTQFSRKGEAAPAGRSALQEVQRWIAANPAEDLGIVHLAKRMQLSPRHFARLFKKEVGITPADWIVQARVASARRLLESGAAAPKEVAARCGFADVDTLRRAFARLVGVTPAEYRKRYLGVAG